TEREREVLRLVADELQNKQIGRVLGISERTVKYHLTAILTRLGADNRAQAVAIATGRGLLDAHGR
ncbi:MAG: LuxR C-terminal-related transcriptional regulator, partial [Actinomycetota bacterium]|nr:LuxR C-terminal-related transcriptional regulator [Actinomycetota bacterium]